MRRSGFGYMQEHRTIFLTVALLLVSSEHAFSQDSTTAKEIWPQLSATYTFPPRLGVKVYTEKHDGEDVSQSQWKVGALLSYRMKRILKRHREDIDEENEYNLVVAGGYEFIRTEQESGTKREHRVFIQTTPKYMLPAGFLLQDRSRAEFRWTDGTYNFRYRNKLIAQRAFKVNNFRYTPYASGELFWDRNKQVWNQNHYAFGVQIPYKKLLMLDTYYLRQNCTTCNPDPLSVFGVTLNFYFRKN
jgi:Protein of unknown function (DUF2490)